MFNPYSLVNSLQNEFKTGNIIIDMIFGLCVAKIIENMFNINIFTYLTTFVDNIRNFRFGFIKGELCVRVKIDSPYDRNKYLAMIQFILQKNNINIKKISYNYQHSLKEDLLITHLDNCLLENNIYVKISSATKDENKHSEISNSLLVSNPYTTYTILFYSYVYNSIKIGTIIENFISLYEIESNKKLPQICENMCQPRDFISYKTFDNLFFESKDNLVKIVNRFINSKEEYKRIGKQYTLTILLYGEAGCGKTSVLKALGNMLKKDIHTIHINSKTTIDEFNSIWFENLKTSSFDSSCLKDKIIHLPEIDYQCDQFLSDNLNSTSNSQNDSKQNIVIQLNKNNDTEPNKDNHSNKNILTKAFLRELLDGVSEQEGRIIILTTNNIERLDPILFRDGRIDLKIKFDKMSAICLRDYLEYIFKTKINENIILPNAKFTPATVQTISEECLANNKTIYDCIDILHEK